MGYGLFGSGKSVKKVSSNGIKGNVLKWIESILTDRQRYVTVKGRCYLYCT